MLALALSSNDPDSATKYFPNKPTRLDEETRYLRSHSLQDYPSGRKADLVFRDYRRARTRRSNLNVCARAVGQRSVERGVQGCDLVARD